jgi:hypothetical protein
MEIRINNLINNTKSILYINSNDTVYDIKNIICSSLFPYINVNASETNLYYIDKKTNNRYYMLSPYRTILSYTGIFQSGELFIEKSGFQLNYIFAILLENLLPLITIYYLYNNEDNYTKLNSHKYIFFLIFVYFLGRLFINLKCYNDTKYQFSKLIINTIIYWLFFSVVCGYSIFDDELGEMNIYSYFFAIIFLFCEFLYLRLVNEYKDNDLKNIIYKYVKYPFYLIDCFIWISLAFIIYNNKILYFTIIKIFYNVYSAFEQYIEDRGIDREIPNRNDYDFENHINQKIIFPFIL